jgi:hypothetical protein
VLPALVPIVERPRGALGEPVLRLGVGTPPQRVVLSSHAGQRIAQVQQDRIAAHRRRNGGRPSFSATRELLGEVTAIASAGLGTTLLEPPHQPELVEVIYDNVVRTGGGWTDLANLHRVLRIVSADPGEAPYDHPEQARALRSRATCHETRWRRS